MIVQIEVDENGMLRVSDPNWRGKSLPLSVQEWEQPAAIGKTNWDELWKIFKEAEALDIPRRTPDEILWDLHELRESE